MYRKINSTKDRIISSARAIFWERGYHGTSMKDIAMAAGCKPANLYNYFPSKEQLLFEILLEEMQMLISSLKHLEDDETTHPIEQLRILIKNQTAVLFGFRKSSKLLFDMEFEKLSQAKRKVIVQLRDQYDLILRKIIRRMIRAGCIPETDERMAGFCVVSMIVRSRIWFSPKGRLSAEETADYLFNFALGGLLGSRKADDLNRMMKELPFNPKTVT
ncbi:MAG TPA: TetR/AcrR family transcriptional regulator [Thermodesulfobacteriota bacterium]|nr:TetR/AcrR family transcriptional regulator [Thermodesulfobacteriota bacterium]